MSDLQMPTTAPLVFVTYTRNDRESALRLYQILKDAGINAWLDAKDLLPGQDWKRTIRETIRRSSHFVALLSKTSIEWRGYVQREIRQALDVLGEMPEGAIFLIPARLDDCAVPYEDLRALHWVDLFPSFEDGATKIVKAVNASSSKSDGSARAESHVSVFDVQAIGGGALAWIPPDSVSLPDRANSRARDYVLQSLDRDGLETIRLAKMLDAPTPGQITSMFGDACAFAFHLVLHAGAPWAIAHPPYVSVKSFAPLPKYVPAYPLPAESAHVFYVEMDDPGRSGSREFHSKYLVHTREESAGGARQIRSEMAELTTLRLIPELPEYLILRVNACTPGIYEFDVLIDVRVGSLRASLPVQEGCRYLFDR
jgi:hypothetical protein